MSQRSFGLKGEGRGLWKSTSNMCEYFHRVFCKAHSHIDCLTQSSSSGNVHSDTDLRGQHSIGGILVSGEAKGHAVTGLLHSALHSCC